MIKEVKGDLLQLVEQDRFTHIVHGCNCFCLMAAGIAGQIARKYPIAYQVDRATIEGDIKKLGNFTSAVIDSTDWVESFTIINMYTQYNPGREFNLAALELGLYKLHHVLYPIRNKIRIGIPHIGAGIGGGNWKDIKKVIKNGLLPFNVTIVEYVNK